MGDGGLALGAAALVHNQKIELSSLYLGTSIQSHNLVDEGYKIVYKGEGFHSLIAKLLFEGEVVAVARGPMEYGPRALGNRSILYAAREKEVNKWLNKRLKRTEFMPFAPVCRDIDAVKNFNLDLSIERYRHMTITCDVTEYCKQTAAAIVHIDGTARPQILFKQDNPDLYEILTQYAKFVDNAILVNTSFNMHEEPIVRTSEEAIHAFKTSGIDYMLLGNEVLKNLDK
jgi:carbamoyltransferase